MDDYNTEELPSFNVAREVLKNAPTCDPNDDWRTSCSQTSASPLIGSYAYANAVEIFGEETSETQTESGWDWYRNVGNHNPTLLLSIFYADEHIRPFTGAGVNSNNCHPDFSDCHMPNRVVRVRLDGSAAVVPVHVYDEEKVRYLITWELLFLSDLANNPKGKVQP